MSVYKPKGSPFYHYDFQVKGARFCGSTGCRERRQAEVTERGEREKAKLLAKLARDLPRTFGEAAARFYDEVGRHNVTADDTLRNLVWLGDAIGEDTLLADIDGDLVAKTIAKRRGQASKNSPRKLRKGEPKPMPKLVSNATVNRTVTEPLKRLLRRARLWGVQLPAEIEWKRLLLAEPQERKRELKAGEGDSLDGAMREDYEPFFAFARATGLRLQECLLRWSEVDWDARKIVRKGKGDRDVMTPITPTVRAILWPLRGHHAELVFTYVAKRTRGTRVKGQRYPLPYNGVKTQWKRLRKRAGLSDFRFHDFRHDVGTKLLRETGNLKLVQKALNHADLKSTLRYAHVLDEDLAAALDRHQKSRNRSRTVIRKVS